MVFLFQILKSVVQLFLITDFCTVPLTGRVLRNPSLARLTRSLTQHSSEEFSVAYRDVCNSLESESTLLNLDADAHFNLFNSTCADIMNSIAPLKYKNHKPVPVPWHTETTRTLSRTCRQAERKWKKDRLQVSYEILRNSYNMFQKAAKCKYLSELITNNCHKPQVLFSTINSVLNPSVYPILEPSTYLCNNFGKFFGEKITTLRSQLLNSTYILHDVPLCSSTWSEFEPIDLISWNEIVGHLKPTICPQDTIPPLFLRQIMETLVLVCYWLLSNVCLLVPSLTVLNVLSWRLILKNQTWILLLFPIFVLFLIYPAFQRSLRKLSWLNYNLIWLLILFMRCFNLASKLYTVLNLPF